MDNDNKVVVKITQLHKATVSQMDSYLLSDEQRDALADLPEAYQEEYVLGHGEHYDSSTEIEDFHETISVEVTW